ncbi:FAD-dependent oxidoreductase [bacterium]|nr:MAG: FAD-dependent oxidoreductase [bacterium]
MKTDAEHRKETERPPDPQRLTSVPLPVLLATVESRQVRKALARDLVARYASRVHVVVTGKARAAHFLDKLAENGEALAAVLFDRTGGNIAKQVAEAFPDAGRAALLVGKGACPVVDATIPYPYSDASESLYPPIDDLVESYLAGQRETPGLRLVGPRWSTEVHETKSFLASHGIAYEWREEECAPSVELPDGTCLNSPDRTTLAEAIGLQVDPKEDFYDLVVIGGGPAGLAAAVYAASEGLSTVILERCSPGGQAGNSARIENYLGFPDGLSGDDLTRRAVAQAQKFGVEIVSPSEAAGLRVEGKYRIVTLGDESELRCRSVLIATGVDYRRLDIKGEDRLYGRGVYYGSARSEAILCREEEVAVVGGANSAGQAALHLAQYAKKVTMLVRGADLGETMSDYLLDRIENTPNIDVQTGVTLEEACGEEHLEAVRVRCGEEVWTLPLDGLFAFIGAEPRTEWLEGTLARDRDGFILAPPFHSCTNISARLGHEKSGFGWGKYGFSALKSAIKYRAFDIIAGTLLSLKGARLT